MWYRQHLFALLSVWVFLVSACLLGMPGYGQSAQKLPYNVAQTNQAWDGVNNHDWKGEVQHADLVINHFSKLADGLHDMLAAKIKRHEAETPPTGVPTPKQKAATFKYGLMNDVATCYYIKAKSLFALYLQRKREHADESELASLRKDLKNAYDSCLKYPLARCWDPQGWFWSPAIAVREDVDLKKVGL